MQNDNIQERNRIRSRYREHLISLRKSLGAKGVTSKSLDERELIALALEKGCYVNSQLVNDYAKQMVSVRGKAR